jgi:DHA1 family tetracycline resistance protein-like MFS transporter
MQHKSSKLSLLILFMVILLDVAGIILVLPVLPPLILHPSSRMIAPETSLFMRDFFYGLLLAIFPLFMFFSTPILGELSDKFGRKKILFICLVGSAFSYGVAAFGIVFNNLWILLLSRALAGLAAGTQPIAVAAIIDASTPETKTKHLSWVVFASSIGLILGPLLGGFTAEKNISSWFSFQTPFILAALVCLLNAVLLHYFFPKKEGKVHSKQTLHVFKGFQLFLSAFLSKKFQLLSLLYFCFLLAWSLYYQTINWFFLEKFDYTVAQLGLFVAFIGLIFAITTSLAPRFILKRFSTEVKAFSFFIFTMGIANIGSAMSSSALSQWLWVILNAGSDVICFTVTLSIFSSLVGEESQGWIMGVVGSINALTWAVGGLIIGPLGFVGVHVPLLVAGFLCFISFFFMQVYRKTHAA